MFNTTTILVGVVLMVIQVLAALPWVLTLTRSTFARGVAVQAGKGLVAAASSTPFSVLRLLVPLVAAIIAAPFVLFGSLHEAVVLDGWGQGYAIVLQLQLVLDFFVFFFLVLLRLWPKGGAVALAAFRESIRQPMFWLLFLLAFVLILAAVFVPYFTFGEDSLMMRDIGNSTLMLFAALFACLAASMSVSEEIEGRTTLTVMSKPVSRRQFLLGKFLGILLAALVMYGLLGTWFQGMVLFHRWWTYRFELPDPRPVPEWLSSTLAYWHFPSESTDLLRGIGMWIQHGFDTIPALILSFSLVMVLLAVAVSLATRVPMVVNLSTVAVIFILANLTPHLVNIAHNAQVANPGSTVAHLLGFVASVFDTLLPDLGMFQLDPALIGDTVPPGSAFGKYLGSVSLYGILYTGIALLFGLILFEDRDLA
jgi:hypothetical protein